MIVYGDPIAVTTTADRRMMEERRAALERSLVDLTARAEVLAASGVKRAEGSIGPESPRP